MCLVTVTKSVISLNLIPCPFSLYFLVIGYAYKYVDTGRSLIGSTEKIFVLIFYDSHCGHGYISLKLACLRRMDS